MHPLPRGEVVHLKTQNGKPPEQESRNNADTKINTICGTRSRTAGKNYLLLYFTSAGYHIKDS